VNIKPLRLRILKYRFKNVFAGNVNCVSGVMMVAKSSFRQTTVRGGADGVTESGGCCCVVVVAVDV